MGEQRQLGAAGVYLRAVEVGGAGRQQAEPNRHLKGTDLGNVLQLQHNSPAF